MDEVVDSWSEDEGGSNEDEEELNEAGLESFQSEKSRAER
jgi:hypothetical protein